MGERAQLLEELLEQVKILNRDEPYPRLVIPLNEYREGGGPVTRIKEILVQIEAIEIIRKAGVHG